ncbi:hypothetical protein B7C42_07658 [Nocardia cerradoensis]|uniref:Uncharacterized protein n=1 Tax=Nocardia cerradoensis TaxID=85688 RepID=A0A231GUD2_9NOCA|nr:hypothetical protein [Nocardia cerradoensis]OXR40233.1 hypothetical protein B7C42_07658 [Nocardia cerradoensis]
MNAAAPAKQPSAERSREEAAAAFMAMLRRVHEVSGLTAGQIAVSSGLPRSTAYRFIDPKNKTVPKNRDQVGAFLQACRISRAGVLQMLELWDEVNGVAAAPDNEVALALYTPSTDGVHVVDQRTKPPEPGFYPWEDPARWREAPAGAYPRPDMTLPWYQDNDPRHHHYYNLVESCPACTDRKQHKRTRRTPFAFLRPLVARSLPVMLLLASVSPMSLAVWLGPSFTGPLAGIFAVHIVVLMVFGVSRWGRGAAGARHPTPVQLGAGIIAGVGAGTLATLAVSVLLVGVLTGFTVFATTPLWIGLTDLSGIATSRGIFTLITSVWCGVGLGYGAALTMFPILGAILIGAMGTAMAMMQLSGSGGNSPRNEANAI